MSSGYFNLIANQPSQIIGPAGEDGATWYYSIGVPSNSTGINGDFNLQNNGDVFQKVLGTWDSAIFSLKGTTGDTGNDGNTVLNGIIPPLDLNDGVDGDFYINTSTSNIYGPKTGGLWGPPTSLIGATGVAGTTDHSALINLSNDDHIQYHTDARGDIRYTPLSHSTTEEIHRISFKPSSSISTNTTAQAFDLLLLNTITQAIDVTLPATPSIGDRILLIDAAGGFNTNALTVIHNGNNIRGGLNDYTATRNNLWVEFIYVGGTVGWNYRIDR